MANIKNVALPNGAIYEIEDAVAREAIRNLHSFNVQIVQSLPITDIDDHTIYFVPASDGVGDDVYDEYMYINNQWEKVGNTRIDLSGYATEEYVDTAIGEIPLPEQSDWNEDSTTDVAHILNRPAIRAGDGENSVVENEIEMVYSSSHWELTGAAGSTVYTTTGSFDWGNVGTIIQYNDVITYVKEFDNSVLPAKITLAKTLSATDALNNTRVNIITNNMAYGKNANAENRSIAYGTSSHAENAGCANGGFSHAEGSGKTTGTYSHSEGSGSVAEGANAHAENYRTTARGKNSHAEGEYTLANHKSQHVFGEYNATDPSTAAATARGDYVEIVGNGTAINSRSNARTLDWSGNETIAGKLTVGAGPTNNMDVATKQYVDSAIPANEVFLVNISYENGTYVANKTQTEVQSALNSGKIVYAQEQNQSRLFLYGNDGSGFGFLSFGFFGENGEYTIPKYYYNGTTNYSLSDSSSDINLLSNLGDTNINNPTAGQVLTRQNNKWVNADIPSDSVSSLTDTTITSAANGQVLTYNSSSSKWVNSSIPAQNGSLSMSSNVITLTNASGATSTIALPVYSGSVSTVGGGS